MLKVDEKQTIRKYEYILKWNGLVEKYVKLNTKKNDYDEVCVLDAQFFKTLEEVEAFIKTMDANGYDKPEIVKVICKAIA